MSATPSFESAANVLKFSAEKFTPAAVQESFQPLMDNLKAWGDLIQEQVQASQAAVAETFEAFKDIKEPQAALNAFSAVSEKFMTMAVQNFQDALALSVAQFKGNVESLEKNVPASAGFTEIASGMKEAASKMESAVKSAVNEGAAAVKKVRAA